ncbi:MAG: GAP family protein [bacterium]
MKEQIFFILMASIFDSLATTQQIIIFVLMFTTFNPVRNSLSYLTGLLSSYFLCGLIGYKTLDKLKTILDVLIPSTKKMSDSFYYKLQLFVGLILIIIGYIYYKKKKNSVTPPFENIIISKLKHMNIFLAFVIGIFISITSFPFSVPYIAVLGKLVLFNIRIITVSSCLLLYNFGYALPMIIIFGIYIFMRNGINDTEDKLHDKAKLLNIKLTTWVFIGMGVLSLIDSIVYFLLQHPIITTRLL